MRQIRTLALGLAGLLLAACAGAIPFNPQGHAGVTTVESDGAACVPPLYYRSGKEAERISVTFECKPDGTVSATIEAGGVKAFLGQAERAEVEKDVAAILGDVAPDIVAAVIDAVLEGLTPI